VRSGYAVDWTRSGKDVLSSLASCNYDCVLLDLGLPDASGDILLKNIRTRGIPVSVIVITARCGIEDRVRLLDMGADDYMVKPLDLDEVASRVRAVLRRVHGPGALRPRRGAGDRAENDLQVKKIVLDQLVGQAGSVPTPLAAPVVLPVLAPRDVEVWLAQAEAGHPAIVQATLGVEVAELEVRKAEAGHKPTLDAQLGYNATNNPQGTTTSVSTGKVRVRAASIGVVFNLPLFAGFATENRVRETLALEDQSRSALDNTRRSVSVSTRAAYLGLVSGASQVKALEAAEASSQVALDANRLGYQVGVRINIDVLNSQSQLFQTKRDLALARYNVLLGDLRLRQANGTLTAEALLALNATLALDGRPAVDSAAPVARPR